MAFVFEKTEIDGLIVIKPHMYPDDFIKSAMKKTYLKKME